MKRNCSTWINLHHQPKFLVQCNCEACNHECKKKSFRFQGGTISVYFCMVSHVNHKKKLTFVYFFCTQKVSNHNLCRRRKKKNGRTFSLNIPGVVLNPLQAIWKIFHWCMNWYQIWYQFFHLFFCRLFGWCILGMDSQEPWNWCISPWELR